MTVEIEHINADAYGAAAAKAGIPAEPRAETIKLIQDKYMQKEHLKRENVPLGEFRRVENAVVLAALGEVCAENYCWLQNVAVVQWSPRVICRNGAIP